MMSPEARGVFTHNEEAVRIWLDPALPSYPDLYPLLQAHGAEISTRHADTRFIVLHPRSLKLFDRYCHPAWLPGKYRYQRLIQAGGVEEWRNKVILTDSWPKRCVAAGRILAEEDNWAGCRKGGSPLNSTARPLPPKPLQSTSINIPLALRMPPALPNATDVRTSVAPGRPSLAPETEDRPLTPDPPEADNHDPRDSSERQYSPATAATEAVRRKRARWGASVARLSDEELARIFSESEADLATHRKNNTQLGQELCEEYGVYTVGTWVNLLGHYRNKTGRFVGRQDNSPAAPRPRSTREISARQTPAENLEDIIRNAHPMSFIEGRSFLDVSRHLALTHPQSSEGTWSRSYFEWRTRTRKFRATADQVEDYEPYKDIFPSYMPLVKRGVSLNDISDRLADEHPTFGHSASEWNVLFGNWLRVWRDDAAPQTPPLPATASPIPEASTRARSANENEITSERNASVRNEASTSLPTGDDEASHSPAPGANLASTSTARARRKMSRGELARIFRTEFNHRQWNAQQVAKALTVETGLSKKFLIQWYLEWRTHHGSWGDLSPDVRYTGFAPQPTTQSSSPESTPPAPAAPAKRSRGKSDQPAPAKKAKIVTKVTEAEEAAMAIYIWKHCSLKYIEPIEEDWKAFWEEHRQRELSEWVEHHRRYRAKINDWVVKNGGTVPGRRANARGRTRRAQSDDSIEFVTQKDKREAEKKKEVEVFEVPDSDEE